MRTANRLRRRRDADGAETHVDDPDDQHPVLSTGDVPAQSRRSERRAPARSAPFVFFGLVFALSVPFWVAGAVVKTPEDASIDLPLSALQLVCPFLAASILLYREEGPAAIRELLTRAVRLERFRRIAWLPPIVLIMPAIYLTAYLVMTLLDRPLPEPQIPWLALPALLVLFLVSGLLEEAGWTGYALDPLQGRWNALHAALVIGVVWALFHLVADLQGDHELAWIAWHRFGSVGLRVLIVWAYNNTGRSLLAAILLHAMDNVSWQAFPNSGSHYDPAFTAPITAIAAGTVAIVWGPRTLARFRYAQRK